MGRLLPSLDAYPLFRKLLHGFVIKLRCQDTERASAESFDNPLPRQPYSLLDTRLRSRRCINLPVLNPTDVPVFKRIQALHMLIVFASYHGIPPFRNVHVHSLAGFL